MQIGQLKVGSLGGGGGICQDRSGGLFSRCHEDTEAQNRKLHESIKEKYQNLNEPQEDMFTSSHM